MKNPLNDRLPEEREPQYEELTTMLQQAYSKPASVTPDRQAQILARVRERLGIPDTALSRRWSRSRSLAHVRERLGIPDTDKGVVSQDSIDIAPFSALPLREVPRQHRLPRWVTLLVAVVVIGALVVTGLLIFQAWTPSTGTQPPTSPTATTSVTASVPDLKGLSYPEANDTATRAGFKLQSSNGDTSGVVIDQSPQAGNSYPVGQPIEVTMGTPTTTVPGNLVGNTLAGAEAILNAANIPFTVIDAGQNPSQPSNTVKQVVPASGKTIHVGQKVTLYVWNLNSAR
jgi:hypothetical protein